MRATNTNPAPVPPPGSDAAIRALRDAFVAGAKWWEWHKENATMWASDRALAEAEAMRRYVGPELFDPLDPLDNPLPDLPMRPRAGAETGGRE